MAINRPRVLLVSPVSDFKGGAEVVLRSMLMNPLVDAILAVPEEGAISDVALAMGRQVGFYHPSAMVQVHRPPRAGPIAAAAVDAVRCAFRLRQLALKHGCDLLHSNGLKVHVLLALLGTMASLKTLVHLHDIPYKRSERLIWRAITRRVSQVIMVSRPCYPDPVLPSNVKVVRNGIDMVLDTLEPRSPSEPLRLGFVGRFHPNKGMDLLVDWFAAVRAAGIDATLTIRGRPDLDLPDYWPGIQARLRQEGLSTWVLEEGWVTGAATYANLDVLLVTSHVPDPSPLVVAEAMSAGVIVAGYPTGGIPTMIDAGKTGLLVKDGTELVAGLRDLVGTRGAFETMRLNAHEYVRTSCSLEAFHQNLHDVYQGLLRAR